MFAADPSAFDARKTSIRALLDHCDFSTALEQAKALNREWPDDITSYQLLAAAQLGLGQYADAEKSIQWMLDLRIGNADSAGWLLVAQIREVSGDLEGASDAVNLAYSRLIPGRPPDATTVLVYAANLQMQLGKLSQTEKMLHDALTLSPQDEAARSTLAKVRLMENKRAEAVQILKTLTGAGANPRYLYQLAQATAAATDYAAFTRSARERIASPDNANRELALYYAGPGKRPAEALRIARIEARRRQDVFTLDALAVAFEASENAAEARRTMRGVLAAGTRDAEVLKHAARMGVKPQ